MKRGLRKAKYTLAIAILLILIAICSYFAIYFYDVYRSDLGITELKYTEKGSISYNVLLNDGKYYNGASSSKNFITEGMEQVNAYFNYNLAFDSEVNGSYSYKVKGNIYNNDKETNKSYNNILLENNDKTTYEVRGNVINISKEFNIDILKALEEYKRNKELYEKSLSSVLIYDVVIDYEVYNYNIDKTVKDTVILSINIPLSEYISDITTTKDINKTRFELSDFEIGKDINTLLICLEFVGAIITFLLLISILLNKYNAGEPRYYKNLNMILRRYNESIISTTLPKLSDKDIILVPDFDSLETVAYRINKPITFTEVKKGKESIFTVIGDKEAYVFRLKDY